MDSLASAISRVANLLRVASRAAGLNPADVMAGPETVALVGTGVDITWARDALGRRREGWQVRATYHVTELGVPGEGRMETEIVAAFPIRDEFQAARQAVLSVVQRRIEAALSEAA